MAVDVDTLASLKASISIPRKPEEMRNAYIWILGVTWALFQLYAGLRFVRTLTLVHVHVLAAISMAFALNPTPSKFIGKIAQKAIDTALTLTPLALLAYLLLIQQRLMERIAQVGVVTNTDIVVGTLVVILLLEATRRAMGNILPIIGILLITYGFIGPFLPPLIAHSGLSYSSMIDLLVLDDRAVFGIPAKISARYVYLFILFGAVLLESGAGDLFLDLAKSVAGSRKGGPAKMAVGASALMATINGSAVANTVSTGSITIPLMKRSGYDKESSGAIEALSSTGGQYTPPVMGAAAFVLAELSGVPYFEVIIYATIPALLFYVGVISSVHFVAVKQGIGALPKKELPSTKRVLKNIAHVFIPIIGLLYVLYATGSVEAAASATVLLTFVVITFRSSTRMNLVGYLTSLRRSSEMVLSSALPTAIAGILIGVVFYSGVASRIVRIVLTITGGQLLATLVLVAIASIILGMGMPTTGAYITVAILAVPAIVNLGIPKISAHLFGLYFSVISMVTPPIALSAFAAASISGGDTWQTGTRAFKLGLPCYFIPFLFLLHPQLLTLKGSPVEIVTWILFAIGLMIVFAAIGVGHMLVPFRKVERITALVGGLIVVFLPNYLLIGSAILIIGLLGQFRPFIRSIKTGIQYP